MMKISKKWLEEQSACKYGIDWFLNQKETDGIKLVKALIVEDKLTWANWLIVRIMTYKQYISYAVFSAEQVIDIYEKKYPDDTRPRSAIEAAKKCIDNPTNKNKSAAYAYAYDAAFTAANAAANAAAYAAANAAAYAAANAAAYAADAADVKKSMRLKILNYGLDIL